MEIFKCALASRSPPPQPRPSTNDIAVVLLLASGRHQWPHNQLFASTAITYQLAEWLSRLSIGPSGLSCLSVLPATRRCPANKNSPPHLGLTQSTVTLAKTSLLRRSGSWGEVGTAWNPLVSCLNFPLCLIQMRLTVDTTQQHLVNPGTLRSSFS